MPARRLRFADLFGRPNAQHPVTGVLKKRSSVPSFEPDVHRQACLPA